MKKYLPRYTDLELKESLEYIFYLCSPDGNEGKTKNDKYSSNARNISRSAMRMRRKFFKKMIM